MNSNKVSLLYQVSFFVFSWEKMKKEETIAKFLHVHRNPSCFWVNVQLLIWEHFAFEAVKNDEIKFC